LRARTKKTIAPPRCSLSRCVGVMVKVA